MKVWWSRIEDKHPWVVIPVIIAFGLLCVGYAAFNPFSRYHWFGIDNSTDTGQYITEAQTSPLSVGQFDANQLLSLTNQDRATVGSQQLSRNSTLDQVAQDRCNDMATRNYYSHVTPDDVQWYVTLQKYIPHYLKADENIDARWTDAKAESIETAFMNSPDHKTTLIDPDYSQIGMAACQGNYQDKSTVYVVEEFLQPEIQSVAPVSPAVSTTPYGYYFPGTTIPLPPCSATARAYGESQLPGLDCI